MRIYLVGGAVRDLVLGRTPKDRDYVVVGSDPEQMLAQGFIRVGASFPVFLHPTTGDEYALARTERRVGSGHGGFETDTRHVSLEDDLRRRDVTVNAMAMDPSTHEMIDPFDGQRDAEDRVLRHVSLAFADDPLRVLRVARFASTLGFGVATQTLGLMSQMVESGLLDELTPERVWMEVEKALKGDWPSSFFWTLDAVGALRIVFPELFDVEDHLSDQASRTISALSSGSPIDPRVALGILVHFLDEAAVDGMCHRLRVPNAHRHAALDSCRYADRVRRLPDMEPRAVVHMLRDMGLPHSSGRVETLLNVVRTIMVDDVRMEPHVRTMARMALRFREFDTTPIVHRAWDEGLSGKAIGERLDEELALQMDVMLQEIRKDG